MEKTKIQDPKASLWEGIGCFWIIIGLVIAFHFGKILEFIAVMTKGYCY